MEKRIMTIEDIMITNEFTLSQKIVILKYMLSLERAD